MNETPLRIAVAIVGSQSALARILGVKPQSVQNWVSRNTLPAKRVIAVERATAGRVTRHQLRPDLYPDDEPNNRLN